MELILQIRSSLVYVFIRSICQLFNGDIGKIVQIRPDEQELVVSFDGKGGVYDFSELGEVVLIRLACGRS